MSRSVKFGIFVAASILASALNYLTYPILARMLSGGVFVEITVALSLLTQISAFLSALVALTVGLTKDAHRKDVPEVGALQSVLFRMFLIVIVVFCFTAPWTMGSLNIPLPYTLPIAMMLLFSVPTAIVSGFFNGRGELIKLGGVAVMTASLQFILTVLVAGITGDGVIALIAMSIGQVLSLVLIYTIFRSEHLPTISLRVKAVKNMRLVRFAVLVSIAVMAVNILQIADLLLVKSQAVDVVLYTDFYVISRIVFFAGMIMIWPFLSWIDTASHAKNVGAIVKAIGIIALGCLVAAVGIIVLGDTVTRVLLAASYPQATINSVGTLSIIYKFLYLVIILFTLYFTVMRSYWAVIIPAVLTVTFVVFTMFMPMGMSLHSLLIAICSIGAGGVVLAITAYTLSSRGYLELKARLQ